MYLLFILVIFVIIGYLLGESRIGEKVEHTSGKFLATYVHVANRFQNRLNNVLRTTTKSDSFRSWALGSEAKDFPPEFYKWLSGLSEEEAIQFTQALNAYSRSLDLDLDALVDGSLDREPILRQVFVEAISVYSQAYQKARQAHKQVEAEENKSSDAAPSGDGKEPGQKTRKRRAPDPTQEATKTAPAA